MGNTRWQPPKAAVQAVSEATIDSIDVMWMIVERLHQLTIDDEPLLDIVRRLNPNTNGRCPVCDRPGRGERDGHR